MSVIVIAVATESGVPIFSRKRGNNENVRFLVKCYSIPKIRNSSVSNLCSNVILGPVFNDRFSAWYKHVQQMPQPIYVKNSS